MNEQERLLVGLILLHGGAFTDKQMREHYRFNTDIAGGTVLSARRKGYIEFTSAPGIEYVVTEKGKEQFEK